MVAGSIPPVSRNDDEEKKEEEIINEGNTYRYGCSIHFFCIRTRTWTCILSHALTRAHIHTLSPSLPIMHTCTHTHTHTHSLSLSLSLPLSLSWTHIHTTFNLYLHLDVWGCQARCTLPRRLQQVCALERGCCTHHQLSNFLGFAHFWPGAGESHSSLALSSIHTRNELERKKERKEEREKERKKERKREREKERKKERDNMFS